LAESIEIIKYYTYWALRGKALVSLEMKKLNCLWAMGLCLPVAVLLMYIFRNALGFEVIEEVKAEV